MPTQIPLNDKRGYSPHVAIVDDDDAAAMALMTWHLARRGTQRYAANAKGQYMHRLVMNAGPRQQIDHINRDGLDNRKENLRFVNHSQQLANTGKHHTASSRFKGVSWAANVGKWEAKLRPQVLGYFVDEIAAARAYDAAAVIRYGSYACTNFHVCSNCGHIEAFRGGAFAAASLKELA